MIEALNAMASVMLDPYLLFLIFITTVLGVIIGVLPGLGATTGAALLLPFTLTMEPVHAIAVLATIYVSATFAGSITAILINTPGTAALNTYVYFNNNMNFRQLLLPCQSLDEGSQFDTESLAQMRKIQHRGWLWWLVSFSRMLVHIGTFTYAQKLLCMPENVLTF